MSNQLIIRSEFQNRLLAASKEPILIKKMLLYQEIYDIIRNRILMIIEQSKIDNNKL